MFCDVLPRFLLTIEPSTQDKYTKQNFSVNVVFSISTTLGEHKISATEVNCRFGVLPP